jgi:hypothetical protein
MVSHVSKTPTDPPPPIEIQGTQNSPATVDSEAEQGPGESKKISVTEAETPKKPEKDNSEPEKREGQSTAPEEQDEPDDSDVNEKEPEDEWDDELEAPAGGNRVARTALEAVVLLAGAAGAFFFFF